MESTSREIFVTREHKKSEMKKKTFLLSLRFKRNAIHLSLVVASNKTKKWIHGNKEITVEIATRIRKERRQRSEEDGIVLNRTLIASNFIQIFSPSSRISTHRHSVKNNFHLFVFHFHFFILVDNSIFHFGEIRTQRVTWTGDIVTKTVANKNKQKNGKQIRDNKWFLWKVVINLILRYEKHFILHWQGRLVSRRPLSKCQTAVALIWIQNKLEIKLPSPRRHFEKSAVACELWHRQLFLVTRREFSVPSNTVSLRKLVTQHNWKQCDNIKVKKHFS